MKIKDNYESTQLDEDLLYSEFEGSSMPIEHEIQISIEEEAIGNTKLDILRDMERESVRSDSESETVYITRLI